MKSHLNRIVTAAILGAVVIASASSSYAAPRAKHHRAAPVAETPYAAPSQYAADPARAAHPDAPPIVLDQTYACFTDEGYGHFASCDQAGF